MWLFLAFLLVPLVEIALFIQVGGWIGLWPTLAIVVLTAAAGTLIVRSQGRLAMAELRGALTGLRDPSEPLAHGAMILFSGALLLTPGFFTDAVGFALLVPPVRRWAYREITRRVRVSRIVMGPGSGPGSETGPAPGPHPAPGPRPAPGSRQGPARDPLGAAPRRPEGPFPRRPGSPPPDSPPPDSPPEVVEGEWSEVPPGQRPTHRPRSGWTRH